MGTEYNLAGIVIQQASQTNALEMITSVDTPIVYHTNKKPFLSSLAINIYLEDASPNTFLVNALLATCPGL